MIELNLFIVGMEKCGTTALANWIVENELAQYRVPNIKEPCIYVNDHFRNNANALNSGVLLDASVAYATNASAIERLPEHDTKIVLCLRNAFERSFSAYRQYKIICQKNYDSIRLQQRFPAGSILGDKLVGESGVFKLLMQMIKMHFPRTSDQIVEKYIYQQADNILNQDFYERIQYEIGFFLSRREFPFFSVLNNSFYAYPLKRLLSKYIAKDLCVLTVKSLKQENLRRQFVKTIFDQDSQKTWPEIAQVFSVEDIDIGEVRPDFSDSRWDNLRAYFRQDFETVDQLLNDRQCDSQFIDRDELSRYLLST